MEERIWTELDISIKHIRALNGQKFNPRTSIYLAIQSIMSRIAYGKPINPSVKSDSRLLDLIQKLPDNFLSLLLLDMMPVCRFLPYFRRRLADATAVSKEIYELVDAKIDEALRPGADESFVSVFVEKGVSEEKTFDRLQLRIILLDLTVGGVDTVATQILWAIILLANNEQVQGRLQKEIDSVVPRDRLPSLSDMSKMEYVEVTILEVMRLKTIAPMAVPHSTLCDTQVGGYFVPKGAQVSTTLHLKKYRFTLVK